MAKNITKKITRVFKGGATGEAPGGGEGEDSAKKIFDITNPSWWWPSLHEIFIFGLAVSITYVLVKMFQYNSVHNQIIATSRCYKDKHAIKSGGVQYATATNARNEQLYTVSYNLSAKQSSLECACKSGEVVNTFKNIPTYDLNTNSISIVPEKQCNCDSALVAPNENIYHTGYPAIVKFMNTAAISKNVTNDTNIDTSYFLPTN
jgi:hypothetical protein